MPAYANYDQTEAVRWKLLVQNLYEDAGVAFPFSGSSTWQTYVRAILELWGRPNQGAEGALIKYFASALNDEYSLGATINMGGQSSSAMYAVSLAATGDCRCPAVGLGESLAALIDWSAGLLTDTYLRPDGNSRFLRPDGLSLYLRP